jgi:hypothetical protein
MLLRNLHSDGEIVSSLRREVDIDSFLDERRVGRSMVDFYHV